MGDPEEENPAASPTGDPSPVAGDATASADSAPAPEERPGDEPPPEPIPFTVRLKGFFAAVGVALMLAIVLACLESFKELLLMDF